MKVLTNNNYIEVTCPYCKSKLGVHVEDIRYNEIPHNCAEFEADCGVCGRTIEVVATLIPSNWIRSIVPDNSGH